MWPRSQRLRRVKDIKTILHRSRRVSDDFFTVRVRVNNLAIFRSTVVVGTTVSKRAIVRNRVKRQVRHFLRALLPLDMAKPQGWDIMITVKKPLLDKPSAEKYAILERLLRRVGILKI